MSITANRGLQPVGPGKPRPNELLKLYSVEDNGRKKLEYYVNVGKNKVNVDGRGLIVLTPHAAAIIMGRMVVAGRQWLLKSRHVEVGATVVIGSRDKRTLDFYCSHQEINKTLIFSTIISELRVRIATLNSIIQHQNNLLSTEDHSNDKK